MEELRHQTNISFNEISLLIETGRDIDTVVTRLKAIQEAHLLLDPSSCESAWFLKVSQAIQNLTEDDTRRVGRPSIQVDLNAVEVLLSMNFRATKIAKLLNVSLRTLRRRMSDAEISVQGSYSNLSWTMLKEKVLGILQEFPNTGFKRMQGYLLSQGLKVPVMHIRQVMWEVDPQGVYGRLSRSRVIVRRRYFVPHSNSMWHIDTHLKLKRWGFVIRGGMDGKSRTCVFLEAGLENSAASNLQSFLKAVEKYGIPFRCRSDKGGENVLVAEYMLQRRGTGRSSHICGRSVHNQRIERFWVDVQTACLSVYKQLFINLEVEDLLSVENPIQMSLLHKVFLPRINSSLTEFMDGWNSHPLSSENCMSPNQLMLLHQAPPQQHYLHIRENPQDTLFHVNEVTDIENFGTVNEISLFSPMDDLFTPEEISVINEIDVLQESDVFGADVYLRLLEITNRMRLQSRS